jgi:hypothetical protein
MLQKKILIGADPELFVYTKTGRPLSAHNLLTGSKYEPTPVKDGAIQVDGVAAEFNITPAETVEAFVHNISSVQEQLLAEILKKQPDAVLRATPVIKFTRLQWSKIPDEAKELGCEPDFSAYTPQTPNKKPSTDKFMRTGSGHVHVSWGEQTEAVFERGYLQECASLVWHFDTAFSKSVKNWDKDTERMELYGAFGAFRPKPYGVEYRTLSNAWLNSEKSIRFVYNTVHTCTAAWLAGMKPNTYELPEYF